MKNNKKGFTLAELLIVVAIIAVLVAIAIPVFNNATTKAAQAADAANIRACYAEQIVKSIDSSITNKTSTFTAQSGTALAADATKIGDIDLPAPIDAAVTLTKGTTFTVTIVSNKIHIE